MKVTSKFTTTNTVPLETNNFIIIQNQCFNKEDLKQLPCIFNYFTNTAIFNGCSYRGIGPIYNKYEVSTIYDRNMYCKYQIRIPDEYDNTIFYYIEKGYIYKYKEKDNIITSLGNVSTSETSYNNLKYISQDKNNIYFIGVSKENNSSGGNPFKDTDNNTIYANKSYRGINFCCYNKKENKLNFDIYLVPAQSRNSSYSYTENMDSYFLYMDSNNIYVSTFCQSSNPLVNSYNGHNTGINEKLHMHIQKINKNTKEVTILKSLPINNPRLFSNPIIDSNDNKICYHILYNNEDNNDYYVQKIKINPNLQTVELLDKINITNNHINKTSLGTSLNFSQSSNYVGQLPSYNTFRLDKDHIVLIITSVQNGTTKCGIGYYSMHVINTNTWSETAYYLFDERAFGCFQISNDLYCILLNSYVLFAKVTSSSIINIKIKTGGFNAVYKDSINRIWFNHYQTGKWEYINIDEIEGGTNG